MDELTTSVLVINAAGEIQMANKQAHALFGYKRGASAVNKRMYDIVT